MAFNAVLSWFIKKRIHQIELFKKYPNEVQTEVFQSLIQKGKETRWGKHFDFYAIKSKSDFQKAQPVQRYEDFQSWISRLMDGEQNLLWPTEIKWFAKSSGTTQDKSKFIPVSKEALEDCHYKGGKDLLSVFYNGYPEAKLYNGKSLVIGGSSQINHFSDDSYFGDLSAIILKNLPFWVEYRRTPDMEVALMDKWEEKIQKMAQITSQEDVTNMAGVPSWTLILLKRILEITGKETIREVWPNLQLYMHGGVSFLPYRKQFEQIIGIPQVQYLESYNASEGFFGIQDKLAAGDMLLMLDYGIYFEFIPEEEFGKPEPETILLSEVEIGKNYSLVISTNAGLWRYEVGDTICFTSLKPYYFKLTGRTRSHINMVGEEVIVDNTDRALKLACDATGALVTDYTAGPHYLTETTPGFHEWVIEFEVYPSNMEQFTTILDQSLQSLNSDYEAKRSHHANLACIKVHAAPHNTFYNWLKSRGKLGGQNKVPRLSNDRKIIDNVLAFLHSNYNTDTKAESA